MMAKKSVTFRGKAKPYGASGHFHESRRHSLQAKGIRTGRFSKPFPVGRCVTDLRWQTAKEQKKEGWYSPAPVLVLDDGNKIYPSKDEEGNDSATLFGVEDKDTVFVIPDEKMPKTHFDWRTMDTDADGVPDKLDCDPLDPTKQDDDLELKDLGQYYGTTAYHKISPFGKTVGTDGVAYILKNGYHWFVSDMVIVINMKPKLKKEPFLVVNLKVNPDKSAVATVEDGNNKVLYKQEYKYTDAKRDLKLFLTNDVLMLAGEY